MTSETFASQPAQGTPRGQLKIFLGYAAGVGKTYAMLEAAHQRQREGVNVAVGFIETHDRVEAELLAGGIPSIERKYPDDLPASMGEMDVDLILERKPELVLVDDLAYTNPPGMRHPRRYQDVEELLEAGIHVYSTLSIQHLESLNDAIFQITGVLVTETIPDRVVDNAAEIELVDLPPDELLRRMQAGKVFLPRLAAEAISDFFRKGNLTALREMTMRRAAERVDVQMRDYMQNRAISGPWPAAERLVVCINPRDSSEKLVRSARRLAGDLNAEWMAIYVEMPGDFRMTHPRRANVARMLRLAEELGAKTITIQPDKFAPTFAGTVLQFARKSNVTKIIVAKDVRRNWQAVFRPSLADQLIRLAGDIDIFVMAREEESQPQEIRFLWTEIPWMRYVSGAGLVGLATLVGFLLGKDIAPANLVMVYLLAVVLAAVYLGRGPSILASVISVLIFDFFFVPPYMTLSVDDTEYLLTFLGLFLVGNVISFMALRAQDQADAARRRENDTQALLALSRDLSASEDMNSVIEAITTHIRRAFDGAVVIHLADSSMLQLKGSERLDTTEAAAALWAYNRGEPAGQGTQTLSSANYKYFLLKTAGRKVGVLGIGLNGAEKHLTADQTLLLQAFIGQAAQAIAQFQMMEETRKVKLSQVTENLQSALLNSISHDLRTPLVSITGALSTLEDQNSTLNERDRLDLIEMARGEASRLNRLVGNLLEMTRLEGGAMKLKREQSDIQDLVGAVLGQMESRLSGREIGLDVPSDLPMAEMDFVLMVQVLTNLLDNALKYSPPGTSIHLRARADEGQLMVSILDQGIGIPVEYLERVFDKFYRVPRFDQPPGTGLGLAICKGIVEAHGGRIWAENRPEGGTMITFAIPLEMKV